MPPANLYNVFIFYLLSMKIIRDCSHRFRSFRCNCNQFRPLKMIIFVDVQLVQTDQTATMNEEVKEDEEQNEGIKQKKSKRLN